jgi:hypothetical protein
MNAAKREPSPSSLSIFLHGCRFADAFCRLSAGASSPADASFLGAPINVLSAFASEIFLKCLVCLETGEVRQGHHLRALFDVLSDATQTRIEGRWDNEIVPMRSAQWDAAELEFGKAIPRELRSALSLGSESFKQLRYSYEPKTAATIFYCLGDLPIALKRVIFELEPEWRAAKWPYRMIDGRPTQQLVVAEPVDMEDPPLAKT